MAEIKKKKDGNKKFYVLGGFLLAGGILFAVMAVSGSNDINHDKRTSFSYGNVARNTFEKIFAMAGIETKNYKMRTGSLRHRADKNSLSIDDWIAKNDKDGSDKLSAASGEKLASGLAGAKGDYSGSVAYSGSGSGADAGFSGGVGGAPSPASSSNFGGKAGVSGGKAGDNAGKVDVSGSYKLGGDAGADGKSSAMTQLKDMKGTIAAGLKTNSAAGASGALNQAYAGGKASALKNNKTTFYNDKGLNSLDQVNFGKVDMGEVSAAKVGTAEIAKKDGSSSDTASTGSRAEKAAENGGGVSALNIDPSTLKGASSTSGTDSTEEGIKMTQGSITLTDGTEVPITYPSGTLTQDDFATIGKSTINTDQSITVTSGESESGSLQIAFQGEDDEGVYKEEGTYASGSSSGSDASSSGDASTSSVDSLSGGITLTHATYNDKDGTTYLCSGGVDSSGTWNKCDSQAASSSTSGTGTTSSAASGTGTSS